MLDEWAFRLQNERMRYFIFALTMCACVHADQPKQNNQWLVPPAKYGDVTVPGTKAPAPEDATSSGNGENKKNARDDTSKRLGQ